MATHVYCHKSGRARTKNTELDPYLKSYAYNPTDVWRRGTFTYTIQS